MDVNLNRIKKVQFDVQHHDQASALNIQNKIISQFNGKIVNIIDKHFPKVVSNDILRAESIELDLGTLSLEEVENNLSQIFESALVKYLKKLSRKIESGDLPKGIILIKYEDLIQEYIFYFFSKGVIPWNLEFFGKENSVEYWINYLFERNHSLEEKTLILFQDNLPRRRLLSINTRINKGVLYTQLFTSSISKFLLQTESLLQNVFVKIGYTKNEIRNETDHFIIWLGTNIFLSKKSDFSTEELANEFFTFMSIEISHRIYNFIGASLRQIDFSEEEKLFVDTIESIHLKKAQEVYEIQFMTGVEEKIVPLTDRFFDQYLKINQQEQYQYIKKLSEQIISLLTHLFTATNKQKVEDISRGIIIESVKGLKLPLDSVVWLDILLKKITSVFGPDANRELLKLITKEKRKLFDDSEKYPDKISLSVVQITDGVQRYEITLQQALKYFDLISDFGFYALKGVFKSPKESFEKIVVWLNREHNSFMKAAVRNLQNKISPLNLWRLNQELSKDILNIINHADFKAEQLGKVFLLEVLERGFIPFYEFNNFGRTEIKKEFELYIEENIADLRNLIEKYRTSFTSLIVSYIQSVFSSSSSSKFNALLKEFDIQVAEITEIKTDVSLIKLQSFLPLLIKGLLSESQTNEVIKIIKDQIDSRSIDFAIFLISLPAGELSLIKQELSGSYATKVEQLLISYKKKYEAEISESDKERILDKEDEKQFRVTKEGEISYISNAGLVIINPYIVPLFTRLKLVENKMFINEGARLKGMQLLQYIANKNDKPENPELILNKILVGMNLNEPIGDLVRITDEEKEMCDGLLDAIINHWSVLKSTSRDNLRASFFMRNGKISFEESNWRLIVEQKSIDVLIDKMPWSVSMIKLPWMKYPLLTDWR